MTPTPRELDREIDRLLRSLSELREEYRWAYHAALQPSVVESAGSQEIGQSDPTGGVVVSPLKTQMRGQLRGSVRAIREAANIVAARRQGLARLMGQRGVPTLPRGGGPRTASRADLEAARAAQQRRRRQGEGFGET